MTELVAAFDAGQKGMLHVVGDRAQKRRSKNQGTEDAVIAFGVTI